MTVPPGVNTFVNTLSVVYTVRASGWTVDLVLNKVLHEQLTGLLTVGVFMWQADYSLRGTNISEDFEDDGVKVHLGLALQYALRPKVFLRFYSI